MDDHVVPVARESKSTAGVFLDGFRVLLRSKSNTTDTECVRGSAGSEKVPQVAANKNKPLKKRSICFDRQGVIHGRH